jgi:iron complex outermembrane receptor protein
MNKIISIGSATLGAVLAGPPALADVPQDDAADLPTIVVTADPRRNRVADELVQPVSVLAGDELDLRQAGSVGAVLDGLPGVANADFGPGVGRPVIRGLQGSRVQVLEDGLRTADVAGEGADHAVAIDPAHAEQIEVFRGPATLLFGSGAAGGVVNVRTNRFNPVSGDGLGVRGGLSYGENGNDRQGRLGVEAPISDQFVLRADASLRRTSDFSINGFQQVDQTEGNKDRLRNSDIESDSYSFTGLVRDDWGFLGLGFSTWDTDYGIPENFDARPIDMGGQGDEFERIRANYDRVDLRGEFNDPLPGFSLLRLKMAYTEFEQQEVEFEFERTPQGGELDEKAVEAAFANDEFESRVELVHLPIGSLSGVVGVQVRDRDFSADLPEEEDAFFYVRPNTTRSVALFALEELPTAFGRLEFGARVERERSDPDDVIGSGIEGVTGPDGEFIPLPQQLDSRTFNPVSLSFGTLVDLDDRRHLRAGVTWSQRAPSPEQLYAFGRHAAAGTFEVGDPRLGTEDYLNFEAGIDRHIGILRYDATVFYNRVDDFIFLASDDDGAGNPVFVNDIGNRAGEGATVGCVPGDEGLYELRNQLVFNEQANAELYGAEFGAELDLVTGPVPLVARFSGDYVRGKLRDGGNLPRMTPARLGVGFDTSWQEFDLRIDYRRVFTQNDTGVAEDSTSGFDLVSFDLLWSPAALNGARVFLQGRNLLDEDGRLHQSFFKDEAPIIGRAFMGGIRFEFGG